MTFSRREFMGWLAAATTLAIPGGSKGISLLDGPSPDAYQPSLMPSENEVWDQLVGMARLGPKYTGNKAHQAYIDFLDSNLRASGLEVARVNYKFNRWEAHRWAIEVASGAKKKFAAPVSSYFPYSGQTPAGGVTGELVYAGTNPAFNLSAVRGKIAFVDCPIQPRPYGQWYEVWGVYPQDAMFPAENRPARAAVNDLTQFQKAGALAVILGWTDVSDDNAADQYAPFSRPLQNIPGLWVGRETGAKLRALAADGATATVTLEAEITPDSPTDTLMATLPGSSEDEVIIVNSHTDGPNATEENGGVGILALAKYFAKIPKADRRRTLVFPLTTGHFALPYVPSIRGVIESQSYLIKKTVAALTVEHLGCLEWKDDDALNYKPTGENEWSVAITPRKSLADVMLEGVQGSLDRKTAVVNPAKGGFFGEGSPLSRAGVPTIGYIPMPSYLLAGPANGCIEKLSGPLMHSQIEVFAKVIHRLDRMSAADLKGA
ncbi:MAG TPA: hypothetical protein VJO53_13890 [Candidatus Acidoferrales bacterium]|nr:hypothetical protein [Candidatus Acidoferrales bacterium]